MLIPALFYYLFVLPASLLPMRALYCLSDLLFVWVYFVFPYRKKVVLQNLSRSFPTLSPGEIAKLARLYYAHFCDLIVESIKAFSISEAEVIERMKCRNPEVFIPYAEKGQNVLIGGGHYNNYEWFGMAIDLQLPMETSCVYKPLSNAFFEEKMRETRQKYGLKLIPIPQVKAWVDEMKRTLRSSLLIFATDQSPGSPSKAHWMRFLNQDTAAIFGLEKYARETGYPVFFGAIHKVKRGYYEFDFTLITENPRSETHGWLTEEVMRRLEKQIIECPPYWLWSHRRWKHQR